MPGLIGFTDKHHKYDGKMLLNMRCLLKHFDSYVDDDLYFDESIYASRTHLGIIDQGKQPYISDNRFLSWMEGEFYNQEELRVKYNVTSKTDNELFSKIYNLTKSFDFLRDIDGYYVATLYDKNENKLYLITDRFGFKPLYWGMINGNLVWSSELKGFLGHIDFKPSIDSQAVKEFFDMGYLLENRTWFKGIEFLPPASVLMIDLKESKTEIRNYWSWTEIKPLKKGVDEREIAEELGRLFIQSVHKRVNNNERIGLTLSSGLDSRAILAAVPEDYNPLHCFTFGQEGCDDIRVARKAGQIRGVRHHFFKLNSNNWLMPRVEGVWKSDGAFNLLHMHEIGFADKYGLSVDFILDGFWGDSSLGGTNVTKNPDKSEEYMARNSGRRFINQALVLIEAWRSIRKPFASNDLINFIFSMSDSLRGHSYIYKKMLLKTFPDYYKKIPWQKTGCPISYSNFHVLLIKLKNRILNEFKREYQRFGFNFNELKNYHNYPEWIRQEPAKSFFEKALLSKDAIYPEYIDKNKVHTYFKDHIERKANCHNELCLALTFELWLQQVFEGRFRE